MTPNFIRFLAASFSVAVLLLAYHLSHAQDAPNDWSYNNVQPGEPSDEDKLEPPAGSFGFKGCGKFAVWVFLKNGKSYRYDSDTTPLSPKDLDKLFDWLDRGPTDVYAPKSCGESV